MGNALSGIELREGADHDARSLHHPQRPRPRRSSPTTTRAANCGTASSSATAARARSSSRARRPPRRLRDPRQPRLGRRLRARRRGTLSTAPRRARQGRHRGARRGDPRVERSHVEGAGAAGIECEDAAAAASRMHRRARRRRRRRRGEGRPPISYVRGGRSAVGIADGRRRQRHRRGLQASWAGRRRRQRTRRRHEPLCALAPEWRALRHLFR